MVKTYKNLFTTVAPNEGTDFIAIYGTTTYNEISGALANEKTIFVKVNYDTDKYRYAPLTGQTVIDGETNYYTFTCVVINTLYTYKLSELDAWSSSSKDLEEVDINDINSGSATSGKVITANGSGGASWESIPNELPSITNNAEKVLKVNSTATGVEWALSNSDSVFVATYGTTTYSEILAAYNAGKFIVAKDYNHDYYYLDKVTKSGNLYTFKFSSVSKAEISSGVVSPIALFWDTSSATTGTRIYSYNVFYATGDLEHLTLNITRERFFDIWNVRAERNIYLYINKQTIASGTYKLQGTVIGWNEDLEIFYFKIEDPAPNNGQDYSGIYAIYSTNPPTIEKLSY